MCIASIIEGMMNNAIENNSCNLTTCRYNTDGKCTNEEKRKECVEASMKVLCLEEGDFLYGKSRNSKSNPKL